MRSLRSLIDWLPYYFRANDTYVKDGKGLFERYLEIFGNYFEDKVIGDINTLGDILDVDNTPEVYLGYLWEFLGSMPYANPHAIDPERWKLLFNGFDSPTTVEALKRYWIYPMNTYANGTNDHFDLTDYQVRSLVKYSIALYSIRGTKRFFEILLKLYGIEVTITISKPYPDITIVDDDDSDYYGSDQDYYGIDEDYAGSVDSLFDSLSEVTKLDSEWMNLDEDTIDQHQNCAHFVNVNFLLNLVNYSYVNGSNEFLRLQDRMFNLINMFLPLGVRPHLIWKGLYGESGKIENKVARSIEVYVDRVPIDWEDSDDVFVPSTDYPGWYRVYDRSTSEDIPARDFDWAPLKFMVKVKDSGNLPAFVSDQPKKFVVAFNGEDYSEVEFEDGHIFTINPIGDDVYYPKFKVSVICKDDFDLTNGSISTFKISEWKKEYNYTLFKHDNPSVDLELSNNNDYISIRIQSSTVRTYTNGATPSPGDDTFIPQQVVNNTTGEYLTLCEDGTTLPDRDGNNVDYSSYKGRCIYVQHIFNPGTYEFVMLERPEYKITIEVTRADEYLTLSLKDGLVENLVDNDNPTCKIRIEASSSIPKLKSVNTRPMFINDNGGNVWSTIVFGATGNSPANPVGNYNNKPCYKIESVNLYNCNSTNRSLPLNITLAYLTKPVHDNSQYLRLTIIEYYNEDHPSWYDKRVVTFYPVTGEILAEEEIYSQGVDGDDEYEYKYGNDVKGSGSSSIINQFFISDPSENKALGSGGTLVDGIGTSVRYIGLLTGLAAILRYPEVGNNDKLYLEYNGLYDNDILIKEVTNPVTQVWNNGEWIILDDPGHYRFYGVNNRFSNVVSNHVDINVLSNKYNAKYYLELEDGDKSDDEAYMIRTLIPSIPNSGSSVNWGFDFCITIDKSIIEAKDILDLDDNAFDLEVLLYRGGTPNRGNYINSYTATVEVLVDGLGNRLPNYKMKGSIQLTWDGSYTLDLENNNFPPGLYCVELHDKGNPWPGSPSYRVVDAYVVPQKFNCNLYFDVDVINKAWTSPAGQIYNIDPVTGKYTWGWYKTNDDYLYSVRLVRYDPATGIPQFRLKLTNNTIGYNRVYMYKLVENGDEWDAGASYPKVLPPIIRATPTGNDGISNPSWLDEAIPNEWGFPGAYNDNPEAGAIGWDYGKGPTGIVGYKGRWLFTGTIYKLGELISGPQEPGKYLFLINQLSSIDDNSINYAYLEVREEIDYSLIVNPSLVLLGDTAVGVNIEAISTAKFTKETLGVNVILPDGTEVMAYYSLPCTYSVYQVGTYIFKLYKFDGGHWVYLGLSATLKVLSDSGISEEYLTWDYTDVSEKEVSVVSTDLKDWNISLQN